MMGSIRQAYLICNARYHDTNFARLQLLQYLAEHEDVDTWVGNDYSDLGRINESDLLITYTCDLVPTLAEQRALRKWVENGGRWYALHGTNAIIEFVGEAIESGGVSIPGRADTPDRAPELMALLGSRFIAHPPSADIDVKVVAPEHPVVQGLDDFTVFDEPYYCEFADGIEILLEARYTTPASAYVRSNWDEDIPRPQLYEHRVGQGSVLYLMLGHCRGPNDMRPIMEHAPIDRAGWQQPMFRELISRGIEWGLRKR
ncbi:MAG: ThuA domain-containing protein [Pseudomonadales bacterium]